MSQSVAVPQAVRRGRRRHTSVLEIGPGTDVGSYAVEARVGAGGFGTVFRARRGGQLYALKFLSLAEHAGWAEREAVVLTHVRHRNVARLCGFSQWPDQQPRYLVLAMEYVAGQRLDEWAREHNPSARRVLGLLRNLSQGLGAAHAEGVVHRDVKEANILVRQEDGEAVLVDFGVSGHAPAARVTPGRVPPGTPEYRSPEAWRFAREAPREADERYRPTPADDMYALGVVLYWLLTEQVLFSWKESVDVEAVLTKRPVPPHERNARVPRELSELCLRLLAKEPGARPDTAALGQAVEELLTRLGAASDEPLFEPYGEHNRTTEGGEDADEVEQWARVPPRPRRGKRPAPPVAPEPVEAAAPAQEAVSGAPVAEAEHPVPVEAEAPAQAPQPAAPAQPAAHRAAAWRNRTPWAAAGGLLLALGALAFALGTRGHAPPEARAELEPALPTPQIGWKVAPPLKPPEAERAAPLEGGGAPAAPVAAGATAPQHEASVKTEQHKQQKRLGPVKKAAALAGACSTLACTGPQVRPEPPSEPCPPGAVEAMAKLKIDLGDTQIATITSGRGGHFIFVREGWTSVVLVSALGDLPARSIIKGRLIFGGERVYGRFTEARERDGGTHTWPVCLELLDHDDKRGMELESGSTADTARIMNDADVRAVDHFKGG